MKTTTKLTFKEYLRVVYLLTFKKRIYILIFAIFSLYFILGVLHFAINLDTPILKIDSPFQGIVLPFIVPSLLLLSIYFSAKKFYDSNKRIQEQISYSFIENKMIIEGESFTSESLLTQAHKIIEYKRFFLFYQSSLTFNILSKEQMTKSEILNLRSILNKVSGIPIKLLSN